MIWIVLAFDSMTLGGDHRTVRTFKEEDLAQGYAALCRLRLLELKRERPVLAIKEIESIMQQELDKCFKYSEFLTYQVQMCSFEQ